MTSQDAQVRAHLNTLYVDNHSWLLQRLRARLGCSQQAADFVQDTFVRILTGRNAAQRLASIREPRSYLTTIANRVMIDHFRRNAVEAAYLEALRQQPQAEDISPEQRLVLLECLLELDAMLGGLGSKVKSAFLMSQLQGKTYAEIAVELQVSVSSVKKYMARATAACLTYALENEL